MPSNYIYTGTDLVSQNELKHWKYIKKKKVNGKWRYYYDIKDALGYDERDAFYKTAGEYIRADEEAKKLTKRNKTSNDAAQARIYADKKRDEAKKAREDFKKTPLGKLKIIEVKSTIFYRRAKAWISSIFD